MLWDIWWCMFRRNLMGDAIGWYRSLLISSIDTYEELERTFKIVFSHWIREKKDSSTLLNKYQRERETIREYMVLFVIATQSVEYLQDFAVVMALRKQAKGRWTCGLAHPTPCQDSSRSHGKSIRRNVSWRHARRKISTIREKSITQAKPTQGLFGRPSQWDPAKTKTHEASCPGAQRNNGKFYVYHQDCKHTNADSWALAKTLEKFKATPNTPLAQQHHQWIINTTLNKHTLEKIHQDHSNKSPRRK